MVKYIKQKMLRTGGHHAGERLYQSDQIVENYGWARTDFLASGFLLGVITKGCDAENVYVKAKDAHQA